MQVWSDNRCVGELMVSVHPGQPHLELVEFDDETIPSPFDRIGMDDLAGPVFRRLCIKIEPMQCACVDDGAWGEAHGQEIVRQTILKYRVPNDAKHDQQRDHLSGGVRHIWRWRAIRVDKEMHERLFDHPNFVPV